MAGFIDLLVPKIKAQEVVEAQSDGVVQPTFGSLGAAPAQTATPSVSIVSNSTVVETGEDLSMNIILDSNGRSISAYSIAVSFNEASLLPQDTDSSVEGFQVDFKDTKLNLVQEDMRNGNVIRINAESSNGESVIFDNETIATIIFQANTPGNSEVSIRPPNSNSEPSRIFETSTVEFPSFTTGSVSISVSGQTQPEPEPDPPTQNVTRYSCNTVTGNCEVDVSGTFTDQAACNVDCQPATNVTQPEEIPDTALGDGILSIFPLALAFVLIIVGLSLMINRKKKADNN